MLDYGKKIGDGTPDEVRNNPDVIRAYLGTVALRHAAMGFFLETLFGGLMAGMLYSLVALGFVLIFKASGVFNFAQGAMVLFAALAMARFAEWIPQLDRASTTSCSPTCWPSSSPALVMIVAGLADRAAGAAASWSTRKASRC